MRLKRLAANQTEITFHNGTTVFFSYDTPVAANVPGRGFLRTTEYHSRTTSKHINAWLGGARATEATPDELGAVITDASAYARP